METTTKAAMANNHVRIVVAEVDDAEWHQKFS